MESTILKNKEIKNMFKDKKYDTFIFANSMCKNKSIHAVRILRNIAQSLAPNDGDAAGMQDWNRRQLCSFIKKKTKTWLSYFETLSYWNPISWVYGDTVAKRVLNTITWLSQYFVSDQKKFFESIVHRFVLVESNSFALPMLSDMEIKFYDYEKDIVLAGIERTDIQIGLSEISEELMSILQHIAVYQQGFDSNSQGVP